MLSPINAGGAADISVLPRFVAPDTQLLAGYDSKPEQSGLLSSLQVQQQNQQLRDLVAKANVATQTQGGQIGAANASNLNIAQQQGALSNLGGIGSLAVQQNPSSALSSTDTEGVDPDTGKFVKKQSTYAPGVDPSDPTAKPLASKVLSSQETFDATVVTPGPNNTTVEQTQKVVKKPGTPDNQLPTGPTPANPNIPKGQINEFGQVISSANKVQATYRLGTEAQNEVTAQGFRDQANILRATNPAGAAELDARADSLDAANAAAKKLKESQASKTDAQASNIPVAEQDKVSMADLHSATQQAIAQGRNSVMQDMQKARLAAAQQLASAHDDLMNAKTAGDSVKAGLNYATLNHTAMARAYATAQNDDQRSVLLPQLQAADKALSAAQKVADDYTKRTQDRAQQMGKIQQANGAGIQSPQQQASGQQQIPPEYIQFLKQNPSSAASFDKQYGAGAAEKILGQ